jgi:hypothetical protein
VSWDAAWVEALDRLELDVAATEQLLQALHSDADLPPVTPGEWTAPVGLGPLPAALRERAGALLQRQLETARLVATELATTRRHANAVRAASRRDVVRPLFVDTAL